VRVCVRVCACVCACVHFQHISPLSPRPTSDLRAVSTRPVRPRRIAKDLILEGGGTSVAVAG
jgi:hypothetical protein